MEFALLSDMDRGSRAAGIGGLDPGICLKFERSTQRKCVGGKCSGLEGDEKDKWGTQREVTRNIIYNLKSRLETFRL
jgi:hypothetical protein